MSSNTELHKAASEAILKLKLNSEEKTNPRGIPKAPFIEKVEDFIKDPNEVEAALKAFQDMILKYQYMELNVTNRMGSIKGKLPEIRGSLEGVLFLKEKKDKKLSTTYELDETLYAFATITPGETVYLWLGANVMLEYTIDEAVELLQKRLDSAEESVSQCKEDLDFLRNNITTVEVNMARLYNWDVQRRRDAKEKGVQK